MTKRLKDMEIKEVSGVTKAANRKQFLIVKSEGGDDDSMDNMGDVCKVAIEALGIAIEKAIEQHYGGEITKMEADIATSFDEFTEFIKAGTTGSFIENIGAKTIREKMWGATDALYDAVNAALNNPDLDQVAKVAKITNDLRDFSDWVLSQLGQGAMIAKAGAVISSERLARLKDTHAQLGAIIAEAEAKPAKKEPSKEEEVEKGDDTTMKPEDIQKAITDALEPISQRLDAIEKGEPAATTEDVVKGVTEAIQKAVEPLNVRLDALEKAKGIKKSLSGNEDEDGGGNKETVKKAGEPGFWDNVL